MQTLVKAVRLGIGLQKLDPRASAEPVLPPAIVRTEEYASLSDGERVVMDVYRPRTRGRKSALLIVEGFDPRGIRAPHVVSLAALVARTGAIAVVPDLPEVFRYEFSPRIPDRVEAAFDHMAALEDARTTHLGIFGISVAGGFAIAAAARESIARRLRLIVGFAPFYDYSSLLSFSLSGRYHLRGEARSARPHPWTRYLFFYNFLDLAVDPSHPEFATLREVLRLRLGANGDAPDRLAATLSGDARARLAEMDAADPAFDEAALARVVVRHGEALGTLSPHVRFEGLRGKVFLVHSEDDDIIPFSESIRMAERCLHFGLSCDLLLTASSGHGGPKARLRGLWTALRHDVPEMARFAAFLRRMLRVLLV